MDRTQVLNNLGSPLLTMNFLNIANNVILIDTYRYT